MEKLTGTPEAVMTVPEHGMLVQLREELYGGSWDTMLKDLRDRLNRRPYVHKLAVRIEEDIGRIERLRAYERERRVKLADYLENAAV